MNRYRFLFSMFLAFTVCLPVFITVSAQDETPQPSDDDVNRIAGEMYCPVCENIPLDVCETQACVQWRELIRGKLAAGWTEDQIKEYFALQYGDRVLAEPPQRGLYWLVYIIPAVFFLAGIFVLFRVFRGRSPKPVEPPSEPPTDTQHELYEHRVEEALKEKRK